MILTTLIPGSGVWLVCSVCCAPCTNLPKVDSICFASAQCQPSPVLQLWPAYGSSTYVLVSASLAWLAIWELRAAARQHSSCHTARCSMSCTDACGTQASFWARLDTEGSCCYPGIWVASPWCLGRGWLLAGVLSPRSGAKSVVCSGWTCGPSIGLHGM